MNLKLDIFNADDLDFDLIIKNYFKIEEIKDSVFLVKIDLFAGLKSSQSGVVTNIDHIKKFIDGISQYEPKKIIIAESENKESVSSLFEKMGYVGLSRDYSNVNLLDITNSNQVSFLGGKRNKFRVLDFSETLLSVDFFVNFSVLKHSVSERISGCWLQQMNFISDAGRKTELQAFSCLLAIDLFYLFYPTVSFLDADIVLGNMGPVEGNPRKIGKIIVGNHPVLVDAAGAKMLGIGIKKIPSLQLASRKLRIQEQITYNIRRIKSSNTKLDILSGFHFLLFRLSFTVSRFSLYLRNLGNFIFLGSLALISLGGKDLVMGRWMSFSNYYRITLELITKISKLDNLLNWRIAINKHVKEQSVS